MAPEHSELVEQNLTRVMNLLGSAPLSCGGVFESMVAEINQQNQHHQRKSGTQHKKRRKLPATSLESATTVEQFAEHVRAEFEGVTGVDLSPARIEHENRPEYTIVRFAMNFDPGKHPITSWPRTEKFGRVIQRLAEAVAADAQKATTQIHSVRYRPFMFTDAVMFVLKVNWCAHEREDIGSVFDP